MNTMNQASKSVAKGLLAAALSLGVFALPATAQTAAPAAGATAQQDQGRFGHAASREERQARRAERVAKRQAALREALKLTPSQEGAWTAFANASKPVARPDSSNRAEWASLTAPQRLEKRLAMSRERTARMEAHLGALNSFYAVLSPEQKKTFDTLAARHGGRKHVRHHGHHRGHGMHQQG